MSAQELQDFQSKLDLLSFADKVYLIEFRECHVRPDLLLVYKKMDDGKMLVLYLVCVSSHTNIFDIP